MEYIRRDIWKIEYRVKGFRRTWTVKTGNLFNAVADFNLHMGGFDTPLRITRLALGELSQTWTMDGRYGIPKEVEA